MRMMEELKAVSEIISQLGEQGKSAFIFWVVFNYAVYPLITAIGAITAVTVAFKMIGRLAGWSMLHDEIMLIKHYIQEKK